MKFAAAAIGAVLGFAAIIAAFLYFAWTTSLAQPVDWIVMSVALFLAPIGAVAGVFVGYEWADR